jgi:AcrR family transcriptional regulator
VPPAPTPKVHRPSQQERGPASLQQRLLAAAEHVLIEGGLEKFTTARVAEKAGVSATTVYRRFAGKKELLAAAYSDLQDRLNFTTADALQEAGTSLGGVLHTFTAALSEVLAESGQVIPVLLESRTSGAPSQGLLITTALQQRFLDEAIRYRADILRANPTGALAFVFQTVVASAMHRAIATPQCPDGLNWEQWADEIAQMTTAYLQTHESTKSAHA